MASLGVDTGYTSALDSALDLSPSDDSFIKLPF